MVAEEGNEEAARARFGKGSGARQHVFDQRGRVVLRIAPEIDVGARIDVNAGGGCGSNPLCRLRHGEQPGFAGHAVFHIDPARARIVRLAHRCSDCGGRIAIAGLHVDAHRQVGDRKNAGEVFERDLERERLPIAEPVGLGHAPATRRDGLRPRRSHRAGAAGVPDIVQHQRFARYMQRGECVDPVHHFVSLSSNSRLMSWP